MFIVFVFDGTPEFDGNSLWNGGVGGSEAALIFLTRTLAERGHRIRVFNRCARQGDYAGVEYRKVSAYVDSPQYDAIVVFRRSFPPVRHSAARRRLFWSTDVITADWDADVFPFVDHVICMSEFHRDYVLSHNKGITTADLTIMPLGVDGRDYFPEAPEVLPKKDRNLLLYCSVPNRGLQHLEKLFPKIREKVPDAELVVTSDYSLWGCQPVSDAVKTGFKEIEGVSCRGNVPRRDLVELQRAAKLMAYPCTYSEGFCLAALECMAAGTIPVTTRIGALGTTVDRNGVLISGKPGETEYDERFVDEVCLLLKDDDLRIRLASAARARIWAEYTWDTIAQRFLNILERQKPRSLPAFEAKLKYEPFAKRERRAQLSEIGKASES